MEVVELALECLSTYDLLSKPLRSLPAPSQTSPKDTHVSTPDAEPLVALRWTAENTFSTFGKLAAASASC